MGSSRNLIQHVFSYRFLINTREQAEFADSDELELFFAKCFADSLNEVLRGTASTPGNVLYIPWMNNGSLWYVLF